MSDLFEHTSKSATVEAKAQRGFSSLLSTIQKLAEDDRDNAAKLRRRQKLWKQLETGIKSGANPPQLLACVRELERAGIADAEAFRAIQQTITQQCRDYFLTYGERFRQACTEMGLEVEGRFPSFVVKGVLRVEVDEERLRATAGSRTLTQDVAVEPVAKVTGEEAKRLFDRPFDAEKFVGQLCQAYRHALTAQSKDWQLGGDVPLLDVHRFMVLLRQPDRAVRGTDGKHFASYPPDEFAVDLGKLLAVGNPLTPDGYHAHLGFVRDARRALFIFNPATKTGQNYGLIAFRQQGGGTNG
jgi:hypothetical protein